MSQTIPLLEKSNTFSDWLVTLTRITNRLNSANSEASTNELIQFDATGSFSANVVSANVYSFDNSHTVNSVYTTFISNNDFSIPTTSSILKLLQGQDINLSLKVESIDFTGVSDSANSVTNTIKSDSLHSLATANSVKKYIEGDPSSDVLKVNAFSFELGTGSPIFYGVEKTLSAASREDHLPTAKSVVDYVKNGLEIKVIEMEMVNSPGTVIRKVANSKSFLGGGEYLLTAPIDDETLLTSKAIANWIGGGDDRDETLGDSIRPIERINLSGNTFTGIANFDFAPINTQIVPTTRAIEKYLKDGTYGLEISANTVNTQDLLVSNTANLFGYNINAISTDLSTLDDHTIPTTNAISYYLAAGQVTNFSSTVLSSNTLSVSTFTINAIANVIDAANTNNTTLATTEGIYNLISGANASIPPLPVTANTISFPSADPSVVINSIATDFTTIDNSSLVTAGAVYNLVTDGSLDATLNSFSFSSSTSGPPLDGSVNAIATQFMSSSINHDTVATTQAIDDYINDILAPSGSSSLDLVKAVNVETQNAFSYVVSVAKSGVQTASVSHTQSNIDRQIPLGYVETPWVYTNSIEADGERNENDGAMILLGANAVSTGGTTGENKTIRLIAGGTELTVNSSGVFINGVLLNVP